MIIVYGNRECFTCNILKVALKDSKLNFRWYDIGQDISIQELEELHPALETVPYILDDGVPVTLAQLEKKLF